MFKLMLRLFSAVLVFFPLTVFAYANPGAPQGFVNDFAGLLSSAARQNLELELGNFEKETGNEIVVATISNLAGDTIENFAVKLFEDWKIGKKGADNGVLFLISKDDRQMRIEVGYGLEGALTDAQSFAIIDNVAKPAFRAGDFDGGIQQAVGAIEATARGESVPVRASGSTKLPAGSLIYIIIFIIFILQAVVVRLSHTKVWWPGGVAGGALGFFAGIMIFGFTLAIVAPVVIMAIFGLIVDYAVSRSGPIKGGRGSGPFWFGGFGGGGGGGGFGGFGGGRSGGGGSSGNW